MKTNFRQHPDQLSLFANPAADCAPAVKRAITQAIADSAISREELAARLTELCELAGLEREISLDMINKWTSVSAKGHQVPINILPLLCRALDDNRPLLALAGHFAGAALINEEDARLLAWAKEEKARRTAAKRARLKAAEAGIE